MDSVLSNSNYLPKKKVTPDMFGTNNPSVLIFIAPTGLADGEYEMTLTTQYSGNTQRILKTARSVS